MAFIASPFAFDDESRTTKRKNPTTPKRKPKKALPVGRIIVLKNAKGQTLCRLSVRDIKKGCVRL
ncbi:MAG: hypothetical protein FWE33_00905 [Defluviitaleaceae bacterium]|nr:hypothetical protein [Defluviitaleaceae bacterium]